MKQSPNVTVGTSRAVLSSPVLLGAAFDRPFTRNGAPTAEWRVGHGMLVGLLAGWRWWSCKHSTWCGFTGLIVVVHETVVVWIVHAQTPHRISSSFSPPSRKPQQLPEGLAHLSGAPIGYRPGCGINTTVSSSSTFPAPPSRARVNRFSHPSFVGSLGCSRCPGCSRRRS